MRPINILGKKFNRLTVLKFLETRGKSSHAYWLCVCACGTKIEVRASHLKAGSVKSCGCYASEVSSVLLKKYATSERHKGKGNPQWKGKNAKYGTLHDWIKKYNKKRLVCDFCLQKKQLDWALKKGKKYSRNVNDYLCLCRSCHIQYDYTDKRKLRMKELLGGYLKKRYAKEGK